MRDVSGARESQSRTKRYATFAALAVAFFFVLTLSGGAKESTELVSGQAKRPTVHTTHHEGTTGGTSEGKDFDQNDADESSLDESSLDEDMEYDEAERKFVHAIQLKQDANQDSLDRSMNDALESIYSGLGAALQTSGVEFTAGEIEEIKRAIGKELEADIDDFVETEIAALLDEKENEMRNDLDFDAENSKEEGEEEAKEQEDKIIAAVSEGVEEIFLTTIDQMKATAATAEKAVLEDTLKTMTGESYVATISGDQVVSLEKGESPVSSSDVEDEDADLNDDEDADLNDDEDLDYDKDENADIENDEDADIYDDEDLDYDEDADIENDEDADIDNDEDLDYDKDEEADIDEDADIENDEDLDYDKDEEADIDNDEDFGNDEDLDYDEDEDFDIESDDDSTEEDNW